MVFLSVRCVLAKLYRNVVIFGVGGYSSECTSAYVFMMRMI